MNEERKILEAMRCLEEAKENLWSIIELQYTPKAHVDMGRELVQDIKDTQIKMMELWKKMI